MKPTKSYLKVPYDLRPAKQVERRMLIEAFNLFGQIGFPISEYQYTGFGSVYFVDFILLHRLCGIRKMLSVEYDKTIRKRVEFNQPFGCVDTVISAIGDVIPKLSKDRRHILWLDYDSCVTGDQLEDVWLAAAQLPAQSILLVTVDAEVPVPLAGPKEWRQYFRDEAGSYLGTRTALPDFVQSKLVRLNIDVISSAIASGLASREIQFIPLFNFVYADGHKMITIGGMLGSDDDRKRLNVQVINDLFYIRKELSKPSYEISVPKLTRKERLYLDKLMPLKKGWKVNDFEVPREWVETYDEIYRFFPAYAELLL